MTLNCRRSWYRSFVIALTVPLMIGAYSWPANGQNGGDYIDLPPLSPVDDAQDVVDQAQSIIAGAKVCIAVADTAVNKLAVANTRRDEARVSRDDAVDDADDAVVKADVVRMAREAAVEAADAATAAAEAAEMARDDLENEPTTVFVPGPGPEGGTTTTLPARDVEEVVTQARMYAQQARDAADRANQAAVDAQAAAAAAEGAAEQAVVAGRLAQTAVQQALDDIELARKAAEDAATAARRAAAAAEAAIDIPVRTSDGEDFLEEARDQAQRAEVAAAGARDATRRGLMYFSFTVNSGEEAQGHAVAALGAAQAALQAAADAEMYATDATACAKEVSAREGALATSRAASAYLSRTVTNRIQKLRPAGGKSFQRPARLAQGMTGVNAGDVAPPDYPPNLAIDVGYSSSRGSQDLFKARSIYVLVMTDMLLTSRRLAGLGAGTEYTRESLLGGSVRRTRGLTATLYAAEILDETFTLVPQVALTHLRKESTADSTEEEGGEGKAMRTLSSLTLLAQKQWAGMEVSGFGQFAYTHESAPGSSGDGGVFLGQAITGGEFGLPMTTNIRLFMGASVAYDVTRSKSASDRFGYEGNLGVRSPLGSNAEFSLSVTASGKSGEVTTGGNVFVKVFF